MIRQVTGTIAHHEGPYVILLAGGIGYKVFVARDTSEGLRGTEHPVTLWTHLAVRDTAMDLYGFLSKSDLDFFEMLITISGIGPKKAMGIISAASFETIRRAVSAGDASYLQKISGVGAKNAEKIVLELKEKLPKGEGDGASLKEESEAHEALLALGYSAKEAKDALAAAGKEVHGTHFGQSGEGNCNLVEHWLLGFGIFYHASK